MNELKIATWNANGLLQHVLELDLFLRNEEIDICLISETHLKENQYIKILGYSFYHTPHPADTARGGSAILIKSNIQHYTEQKISNRIMQIAAITTQVKNKEFIVAAIYCPPREPSSEDDFVRILSTFGNNFIIGGDFNAKHTFWGSRLINPRGKRLYMAARKANCEFFSSGAPTYWPTDTTKVPDLIDFFVGKGIGNNHTHTKNSDDLSSDHTPVILTLSNSITHIRMQPRLVNHKTNWDDFKLNLERFVNLSLPLDTREQIDKETEQFIADVQQAAENSTPFYNKDHQNKIHYPEEIKELIFKKRKARRKWQANRYPNDKVAFNRLSNQLKKCIYQFKNNSISKFLFNLTAGKDSEYSLWKAAKNLKRPQTQDPPIKAADGTWIGNPKHKAEIFAEYLSSVFKPFPQASNEDNLTFPEKNDDVNEIVPITLKELKDTCCNLSNKKSPGYDLITGQIIKELPNIALLKLQHIINACFKLRYVPHHWKIAEVIVIPKPGKPTTEVTSYRPISLLPALSKVFERLLLKRLNKIVNERKLIPNHQFGFRNKHSTIDQVHRITNTIEKALEENKVCSAIFLDVAQAFDKVWHRGLEYKLYRDLPIQYYEILKSYLSNRYFRVRYNQEYSELQEISAGVPQGSVLGPVLYLLYTRDIPLDDGTVLGTFADDTAILTTDKSVNVATRKLQEAANNISNWTKKWRIKINETKSTYINFTYKKINNPPIYIDQKAVPYANIAKYLGMNLDAKLKWKEHIKKKKEELNIRYRKMYWLIGRSSELSIQNKMLLYKQVLKPAWTYGIQLWGCTKKSNATPIQTFQNKVIRGIVNAPWYVRNSDLHRDLNLPPVVDVIQKCAVRHNQRLQMHENDEMEALLVVNNIRRLKRTKPHELV